MYPGLAPWANFFRPSGPYPILSATDHLLRVTESHNQQLLQLAETAQNHERRLVGVEDQTALMLSALNSLLQRMDAFIQGLQKGDGHSAGAR